MNKLKIGITIPPPDTMPPRGGPTGCRTVSGVGTTPLETKKTKLTHYLQAIVLAGGEPVLLSPDMNPSDALSALDGILFTGGGDIPSYFWGESSSLPVKAKDEKRAKFEIPLVREAKKRSLPILGICLGLQTINVALNGTLYLDLPHPSLSLHRKKGDGRAARHQIRVLPGTQLSQILPGTVRVNSRHHQAIKELAEGLKASAVAEDGVIEAVEGKGEAWILGVQWHPEEMIDKDDSQLNIFKEFVKACLRKF